MDQSKAMRYISALSNSDMPSETKGEIIDLIEKMRFESKTPESDTNTNPVVRDEGIKDMKSAAKKALMNLNIKVKSDLPHKGTRAQWNSVYDEVKKLVDPDTAERIVDFNASVRWICQPMLSGYSLCKF